ncbi:hypothetical protein D3C73_1545730 [compost metagenome]
MKSAMEAFPIIVNKGKTDLSVISTPSTAIVDAMAPERISPDNRIARYPAFIPPFLLLNDGMTVTKQMTSANGN